MKKKNKIVGYIAWAIVFTVVAILNLKSGFFVLPDKETMISYQSELFTVSTVFAGFSFSVLGLIIGVFSEKIIEKLRGTTLIQRKCNNIVKSIICFCLSGIVSLIFITGLSINNYPAINKGHILNHILFVNGFGFMLLGIIYFIISVKSLMMIIGKIYGFNENAFEAKEKAYNESIEKIKKKSLENED